MRIYQIIMCLISLLFFTNNTFAKVVATAKFYEMDSNKKTVVFTWDKDIKKVSDTEMVITNQSKDLKGQVMINDISVIKNNKISSFEVNSFQTKKKGVIEVRDNKIFFKYFEDGKQTKDDYESLRGNFVVPSTLVSFIKKNWEELVKGEDIDIRFAVWHRLETVGFELFKERSYKEGNQEIIEIKMKPSSFIIAALVDPIFFRFTKDGKNILSMKGRVSPKKRNEKKNKWLDWDAEGFYTHMTVKNSEPSKLKN